MLCTVHHLQVSLASLSFHILQDSKLGDHLISYTHKFHIYLHTKDQYANKLMYLHLLTKEKKIKNRKVLLGLECSESPISHYRLDGETVEIRDINENGTARRYIYFRCPCYGHTLYREGSSSSKFLGGKLRRRTTHQDLF